MHQPQNSAAAVLLALIISISLASIVQAQQTDETTERGIKLYRQGSTNEAIKVLTKVVKKHADDADAWYYLGLAQYSLGWIGGARTSFEKTVDLRPNSADALAKLAYAQIIGNEPTQAIATARRALELGDKSPDPHYAIAEASLRQGEPRKALEEIALTLKINSKFLPALITKSFAHQALAQYSEGAESLERFLALSPNDPEANTWRDQIAELRIRVSEQPNAPKPAFGPRAVTHKARVLTKPEAGYTEEARKAAAVGTVVLSGVFSSNGELTHLLIVKPLGYGLTTRTIRAARAIKFAPATIDGRLVSQYIQLEYTFNLY